MPENRTYSPTYIDNHPYAVVLPTIELWDNVLDVVGESNELLHWKGIDFWCEDDVDRWAGYHAVRGFDDARTCRYIPSSYKGDCLGYRPVLIPLNPDTLEPDSSLISGITDGVVIKMGTLYMDGKSITTMYPGDDYAINTPDYKSGMLVQLGDSALDIFSQINFIKYGDILIADRNILKNISWDDIDKCGLVYGNGISDPSLFLKKPGLDELINDALAESQKQVSQHLDSEMEQAIKETIKKRLSQNYDR